ncbi:DUF262 domain-containing protein [Niastella caeni]|uniref:DUF262 domain-containing protein n=1 Tax=Niastella caeni TaxID=2569763 RepID=A0A4S8HZE2_9BACT|nr:DUF262 domain-containing protein [Niastella caeni]THU41183.1 DUF262 domain-containing protein [Niastella caeni]
MAIAPVPQNIEQVFSSTTYYIDFYQRQYKWNREPVERLLDDIFYKFNQDYGKIDSSLASELAGSRIGYYFLNTYVTNTINNKVFLVDGQQRFTTITLILIQLYHLGGKLNSELTDWIKDRIHGTSGARKNFWLQHQNHLSALEGLLVGLPVAEIPIKSGITAKNMVENSKFIKIWLENELKTIHQFDTFIYYLLRNVEIVKLEVMQTDVPMVFEVINDRGVRLKPHEILKGKLLGQVDKQELELLNLNKLWENQVNLVGVANSGGENDEIDNFFETFIRSKIASTRGVAEKYTSKNYHRILFIGEVEEYFKLNRNAGRTKQFLQNEFIYFTKLYSRIRELRSSFNSEYKNLYFNQLNDLTGHFVLILSACKINDLEEDEKIKIISYQYDRIFTILHLQKAYVNNIIADLVYTISIEIKEINASDIAGVFERHLLKALSEIKDVPISEAFNYNYFKDVGYSDLPTRFSRYFFSRIEYFIAKEANSEMQQNFDNLVRNNGYVNGYHVEHILAHNLENLQAFNNDEEVFERERNRLGGLLLLRGNSNQSSGNESYGEKLKTYAQSLYWNATLHKDTYHSNIDLQALMNRHGLQIRAMDFFGPAELEERHKLLAQIVQIIWK